MADKSKITDRASFEHKTVCIKGGVIPGTAYAQKFCEYLLETGATDWYEEKDGEVKKWKGKEIKEYKKAWIKQRAGAKSAAEEEDAKAEAKAAEDLQKDLEEINKMKGASQEKVDAIKNGIDSIDSQVKKLEKEKNQYVKSLNKSGNSANQSTIQNVDKQIAELSAKKQELEGQLTEAKKELDKANAEEKEKQHQAKENSKAQKWWYKKLVRWRQEQIDTGAKDEKLKPPTKVLDEYDPNDIIALSIYANKKFPGKWTDFDSKPELKSEMDTACRTVWNGFSDATSIRNDMDPAILEEANSLTPDTSSAFLTGAVSNTFEAAMAGKELIQNPQIIKQRAELMANATMAATARLTSRVTNALTSSIAAITDVTPITSIPIDAANEMLKHILTPDEIMKIINKAKNDDALKDDADKEMEEKIKNTQKKIDEKVQEVNFLIGDKLEKFNKTVNDVKGVLNQGPDWYIDNINKLTVQAEKEAIKAINDVTGNMLETKFQFRDIAVDVVSYNLVMPINEALIKVQLEAIRLVVQMIKKLEQQAKALAQKAIMQLLGLLGA